ncbi:hypothetical protein GCM10027569_39830 [Flindersiella endophytica]
MPVDTAVLIVGGSLNGLSTAAFLSYHGVPCVLIERHPGTLVRFRFRGISARSMELHRSAGIERDIWAVTTAEQRSGGVARAEGAQSVQVPELTETEAGTPQFTQPVRAWPSPSTASSTAPTTCCCVTWCSAADPP